MRVYISGPITGHDDAEVEFSVAESALEQKGHEPVNPFKLNHDHGKTWGEYMRVDVAAMMTCDAVLALPGWQVSRGADIEVRLALSLGIPVYDAVWRLP